MYYLTHVSRMLLAPTAQDTSCVVTDSSYWGMHGNTLDTPNLTH